jgi:chemotaxis protein MotB
MVKRLAVFFRCVLLLALSGCVSQGNYDKKVEEVAGLSRDLVEMQRRNTDLVRENEGLQADIVGLRAKIDELEAARKSLEQTALTGAGTHYQLVAELEREKGRLREDLAKLLRVQDERVRSASRTYESFLERMKDEIAAGQVRITELRGTVTLAILDEALFDSTKTDLSARGTSLLRKIAEILKDVTDRDVSVEAFYSISGTRSDISSRPQTPWRVPTLRSLAVARFFRQSGIDSAVLSAVTSGEFDLAADTGITADRGKLQSIHVSIAVKE